MPTGQRPDDTTGQASAKIIYSTKTSRERTTAWGEGEERCGGPGLHLKEEGTQNEPMSAAPTQQCPLFVGLNLHPPGPTSGWTPKGCSGWASQFETSPAPGSFPGQQGAKTQTTVHVPAPTRPETWHYDSRGGCSDTSFLPKRALQPLPIALSRAAPVGMCQTRAHCGTKRCPRGVLPQQPTQAGKSPGPPSPSQAMGKPGRPFRARVRRRKKVYMPRRHMEERK